MSRCRVGHFTFPDGLFAFWTAVYDSRRWIVFRVRDDTTPAVRAREKGIIGYSGLKPATEFQKCAWLAYHLEYPIIGDSRPDTTEWHTYWLHHISIVFSHGFAPYAGMWSRVRGDDNGRDDPIIRQWESGRIYRSTMSRLIFARQVMREVGVGRVAIRRLAIQAHVVSREQAAITTVYTCSRHQSHLPHSFRDYAQIGRTLIKSVHTFEAVITKLEMLP